MQLINSRAYDRLVETVAETDGTVNDLINDLKNAVGPVVESIGEYDPDTLGPAQCFAMHSVPVGVSQAMVHLNLAKQAFSSLKVMMTYYDKLPDSDDDE